MFGDKIFNNPILLDRLKESIQNHTLSTSNKRIGVKFRPAVISEDLDKIPLNEAEQLVQTITERLSKHKKYWKSGRDINMGKNKQIKMILIKGYPVYYKKVQREPLDVLHIGEKKEELDID